LVLRAVAVIGAGFAGLCACYASIKVFDRRPGLVIDKEGIVDNSSGVAVGRVPWHEITGARVARFKDSDF
jgi:hypothetical protein